MKIKMLLVLIIRFSTNFPAQMAATKTWWGTLTPEKVNPTITNRAYKGQIVTVANTKDLETMLTTRKQMNHKSRIVVANARKYANRRKQKENISFDMECHKASEGNVYDFGYALNWPGVIKDARTKKYAAKQ